MCRLISRSVGSGRMSFNERLAHAGTNVVNAVDWKLYCCPSRMLVSRKTAVGIDISIQQVVSGDGVWTGLTQLGHEPRGVNGTTSDTKPHLVRLLHGDVGHARKNHRFR